MSARIGLTGGIGSGKSTVSARLAELGAVVVDSDVIAREVVAPGTEGLAAVAEAFGAGVLNPDGSLDRAALGRLVFADEAARSRLEAIVHPLVRRRSADLAARAVEERVLEERGSGVVVVFDIPLLVETGRSGDFDAVVVVESDEADQIRRLVRDRGMRPDEATARIAAQATPEQRRAVADYVIVNDGTIDDLRDRVDAVWPRLLLLAGRDPAG